MYEFYSSHHMCIARNRIEVLARPPMKRRTCWIMGRVANSMEWNVIIKLDDYFASDAELQARAKVIIGRLEGKIPNASGKQVVENPGMEYRIDVLGRKWRNVAKNQST